jgi:NADH-quinone oxidoreductase subunit F
MIDTLEQLQIEQNRVREALSRQRTRILVCAGTGCISNGSMQVYEELRRLIEEKQLLVDLDLLQEKQEAEGIGVVATGCRGLCAAGPLVQIEPSGVLYTHVHVEDVPEMLEKTLEGGVVERLLYRDMQTGTPYEHPEDSPFYRNQKRLVLEHCGNIDPESIEEYIAVGGYQALAKVLKSMAPEQLCDEVLASGLRGRGGAGFPTGRKWQLARMNPGEHKYMVCNGDEGDPGAFMNRSVMEGDPHRVLEGLIIAGYAMGADEGYFYVRAEYPLAVRRLNIAIEAAEKAGLLGDNILGSDFSFHAQIKEGAGAFVCGEETALMASIEGQRGMPRLRPPFPAQKGLWGMPTTINNVETLSHVPAIINKGAQWYKAIGTEKSAGTKTFALSGKISNTGLVEIPMGCTVRDMVFGIGGGIPNGKKFKAVQIGGPSGGCLTEQHMDLPMDYDSLQAVGAIVGSGGLVVLDEDNCIVEVARFFMNFIQNESCGKCVACREGTKQMLNLLNRIVQGRGTVEDIDLLEELAQVVKDASLCALGKTAPNPVLTTLRYFRDEYMAHVVEKRCPAKVCQSMKSYYIVPEACKGCGKCARNCPSRAISGQVKQPYTIDQSVCEKCGICVDNCAFAAIQERW